MANLTPITNIHRLYELQRERGLPHEAAVDAVARECCQPPEAIESALTQLESH